MFELSGFVYIKNHVILHVKSKAEKVNLILKLHNCHVTFFVRTYVMKLKIRHETVT